MTETSSRSATIPEPTLKRLPSYYQCLQGLQSEARVFVSCTTLAQELGLHPVQVRKDLQATGAAGRPKVGYHVTSTLEAIETCMGYHNTSDLFLVGAGHLGLALLAYPGFARFGFNLVAAFDADPEKIGTSFAGKPILDLARLPDLVGRMHVQIGVLTVPAEAAQQVADLMVQAGIRAIWNFAPVHLSVPPGVIVRDENMLASLSVLSSQLNTAHRQPAKEPRHGEPEEF